MNLCPELRRLTAEHARWLAELGRAGGAGALLALWEGAILPRCRREEDVLLPELARRIPEADAVIVFTLGDHVALRRLARELRAAQAAEVAALAAALRQRLAEHLEFEERTLFPVLQEQLGCDRLAALERELTSLEGARPVDRPPAAGAARTPKRRGPKP